MSQFSKDKFYFDDPLHRIIKTKEDNSLPRITKTKEDDSLPRITVTKGGDTIFRGKDDNINVLYGNSDESIGLTPNDQLVLPPDYYPSP